MTDKIMIDEELEQMSEGQLLIITARAARKLGRSASFTPEGVLQIDMGDDDEESFLSSDAFYEAWEHEACLMVATVMTARMVGDGLLYEDGVGKDGNILYRPVPGAVADENQHEG
jgi:hypothetical protein